MLTKISSSFEYLLVIFIFTSRFAFRLQIDTNEEGAESTKLNVDNAAAAPVSIADQVLIYGNFKLKGSLLPTLPQSRPADRLLLINFDSYQRKVLPLSANLPNNFNSSSSLSSSSSSSLSSTTINCSSSAIWIDRYKIDRPSNFDQYRDLMLFYSFTVLEQCMDVLPSRMVESFLRNVDFNSHVYLLIYADGHYTPNYYTEMLKLIFKSKISTKVMLGNKVSFFFPEHLDQSLQNLLGSMRPPPIVGQPVQPASDRPTFTLFTADSTDAAELLDTVPCELMSLTLAVASDPSLGLVSGITSTGGNGSPSTLTPSSESLLNSFSRTSVLFVSVSFIILMVISLAWLVFYYVQRFRYNHAKDRLERRLCNAVKKVLTKVPAKTLKFGDKELEADCPVCIEPYRNGDVVRILPCRHIFHKTCVDPWLLQHRTCPMCKSDILKAYGYHIGHHMPDLVDGDHLSTGGRSMDGGILSRHHHRASDRHESHHQHYRRGVGADGIHHAGGMSSEVGSLGSAGTLNGYGMGAATDSDLHDPFFPSTAPSPSLLQPVLHQANTQTFSIIPLTVHNIAPPPPAIMVRPATCPSSSSPLHPDIVIYDNKNLAPDDNNCCNHSATSSDDDSPSSTCSANATASKPLFRISTKLTPSRQDDNGSTSPSLLGGGRFRSAQTGRRRYLQQKSVRSGAASMGSTSYSVDESSLSHAILQATKNVVGRLNTTPRSSSSHDLCFVRCPEKSPFAAAAVVDPSLSPRYFRASSSPRRNNGGGSTCALRAAAGVSPSLESL